MTDRVLSILIADDDEGDRKQMRRTLKQAGFTGECVESVSVAAALAACDAHAFDCALVDYQMPGHDGLYGVEALRDRFPFMATIMVTSHGDETVATEAMKRGASDYIAKGRVDVASVRRAVDNAMEKANLRRKLAAQREELENFASVLVHDLAAPIASIQLFAREIERNLDSETIDRDEVLEHCHEVVAAGARANMLIDTLREYTRVDAKVRFGPVRMSEVLEGALSVLQRPIGEHGARVTCDDLPVVTGNSSLLTQLMQNLVGNALKYCEAPTPAIHVSAVAHGENDWLFSVRDNGIGIPEQYRERVFEPFKRFHDVAKYEGSGLGLATCRKIVERHHGTIRCEPASDGGSIFMFSLPGWETATDAPNDGSCARAEAFQTAGEDL